jgi:predicted transcriptional regulator
VSYREKIILSPPEDISIRETADQIFKRPPLSISPDTLLPQVATFLAIGPQIYVDGIVVIVGKDPVGRISSKHILQKTINSKYTDWLNTTASELMDRNVVSIEMTSSVASAVKIFGETRFAFLPITDKGSLIASLGIRDILPLIVNTNIDTPARHSSSPTIYVAKEIDLKHTLDIMLTNGIRNVVIQDDTNTYLLNDRKILEFLFSPKGREIMTVGKTEIGIIKVEDLDLISISVISDDITISEVAKLLMDIRTPCVLFENSIVTPWDVVMKTIGKNFLVAP